MAAISGIDEDYVFFGEKLTHLWAFEIRHWQGLYMKDWKYTKMIPFVT